MATEASTLDKWMAQFDDFIEGLSLGEPLSAEERKKKTLEQLQWNQNRGAFGFGEKEITKAKKDLEEASGGPTPERDTSKGSNKMLPAGDGVRKQPSNRLPAGDGVRKPSEASPPGEITRKRTAGTASTRAASGGAAGDLMGGSAEPAPTRAASSASAGDLMGGSSSTPPATKPAGQTKAGGGVHGASIGERGAPENTQVAAMQSTIADLQERLAKMELSGGAGASGGASGAVSGTGLPSETGQLPGPPLLPDREDNPNYYRPGGAGPTASAADLEAKGFTGQTPEDFEAGKLAASAPPSKSPHAGYEEVAGGLGGGPMDPGAAAAIARGNQEDASRGGGNRGLMAALGGALGGAKDAVGGALGGALGGERQELKPEHQGKTNRELAALKRSGVNIYVEAPTGPQGPVSGTGF